MKIRFGWVGPTLMAVVLAGGLAACNDKDPRTPGQVWIDDHPTHVGPNGECIEFDDEPCDADPFDLDDLLDGPDRKSPSGKKPSTKPAPRKTR